MSQLNLEEGKRLLSEPYDRVIECPSIWHNTGHSYHSTCPQCGMTAFSGLGMVRERTFAEKHAAKWLRDNADALIAAAEEAEKLREALRALEWAQNINPEADHCVECGGVRLGCSECGAEGSFTRHPDGSTTEPQHKPGCPIGAALPPQETP